MRMVLLISFGMTTRPKSSMRRTILVAFIVSNLSVEWIELTLNLLFDTERKIYWKKSSEAKTAGKLRSYLLGQEGRFETLLPTAMKQACEEDKAVYLANRLLFEIARQIEPYVLLKFNPEI